MTAPQSRTAGPWQYVKPMIEDAHGNTVARILAPFPFYTDDAEEDANAAFIVEACNAYDTLRAQNAALRAALERIKSVGDDNPTGRNDAFAGTMYNLADDALSAALSESQG